MDNKKEEKKERKRLIKNRGKKFEMWRKEIKDWNEGGCGKRRRKEDKWKREEIKNIGKLREY